MRNESVEVFRVIQPSDSNLPEVVLRNIFGMSPDRRDLKQNKYNEPNKLETRLHCNSGCLGQCMHDVWILACYK